MQTIRVWFSKRAEACYISHLDLQRVVQRALKQSGLPVWYTQGFNPHIYLTFALPLSLGQESVAESFDFKTEDETLDPAAVPAQLNRCLPRGVRALRAGPAKLGPGAICWARYSLSFETPGAEEAGRLQAALEQFLGQTELSVEKQTKKGGVKTLDLAPYLGRRSWQMGEKGPCLQLTLPAGSGLNVNPELLLQAAAAPLGLDRAQVTVCRTGVFTASFEPFE